MPFEIAPSPEQTPDAHAAPDISIAGCKLLLVEDNALNAEIAQILLTDEGATVTVVTDGKQAVEIVQNNPPDTFDAVLMDVMMPVMNGIDAAKTIRSLNRPDAKTLPIIAMTANAFYEDAQKCLAAGMEKLKTDKKLASLDEVTVYVSRLADKDDVLKYITKNTKFKNYELIQADYSFEDFYNWYDYFVETESYCNVYRFY